MLRLAKWARTFSVKYNLPAKNDKLLNVANDEPVVTLVRSGNNVHVPQIPLIHTDPKLTTVDSGYGFTVGISENGELFGRGINTMGQLGVQLDDSKKNVELVDHFSKINFDETFHGAKYRAIQVSCGRQHFAALLENGDIVLFGSNHAGQLGARPHHRTNGHHVIHCQALFDSMATQVSCGMDHTVILLDNGQVATFGLGCDGQLGLGDYENAHRPTLVNDVERISSIRACADWTLALDEDGRVFGWGNNEYNQINYTDEQQVAVPTRIDVRGKVKTIASTMNMGIALATDGRLFTWGYGNHLNEVILKDEPTQLHLPNIGNIVRLEPGINTVIVTTDKGVRLALGIEENNMFDALAEDYRFNVENFERLDKINVGYDSILCSVVERPKPVNPFIPEAKAEVIDKPAEVIKVPKPQSEPNSEPKPASEPAGPLAQKWLTLEPESEPEPAKDDNLSQIIAKENEKSKQTYGYQGKNYDPDYAKKKYGATYNPALVKKRSFRAFAPRQFEDKSLKHMLGPELYRAVVIQLGSKSTSQPKSGYKGKNYDPNYLKRVLGPKYDPSRDLDRPNVAWQGLGSYESKQVTQLYKQRTQHAKAKYADNYDPEFKKKRVLGDRYDPNYAQKKLVKVKHDPVAVKKAQAEKFQAKLKAKYGESYDPHYSLKKKHGKDYDPDYLKKVLGDAYDPSRQ